MITTEEVERCWISPPRGSVQPITLPLTYLDIPWLLFPPSQTIFFYSFPISTTCFIRKTLPRLKNSLSLTLHHFLPLAGRLVLSTKTGPYIEYAERDSIEMIIAEADGDPSSVKHHFTSLTEKSTKLVTDLHGLVPTLSPLIVPVSEEGSRYPLLALQTTIFPESGICIGFTLRHVVADGRTFNNFLKMWASIFTSGQDKYHELTEVVHDRSALLFGDGLRLRPIILKQWMEMDMSGFGPQSDSNKNEIMVRTTFVLGPKEIERVKKRILAQSCCLFGSARSLLVSPYIVVCALLWECWIKAQFSNAADADAVHSLGFIAGGITRFALNVPDTYVGNLVGFGRASSTRSHLMDRVNGVVFAAEAISETIKKLNENILIDAENWISEWKVLRESQLHLTVVWSPKMDLYNLNFGWQRPIKIEEVSIDTTGSISLFESRDAVGGIELGVALPRPKMEAFSALLARATE